MVFLHFLRKININIVKLNFTCDLYGKDYHNTINTIRISI